MPSDRQTVMGNRSKCISAAVVLSVLVLAAAPSLASEPPDLSGTWAMIQFMPEIADLPFVGEVSITAVVGLLVRVEQTGSDLVMSDTYCRTDVLTSRPILTSEVPDLVMRSLRPAPRTGRLELVDGRWHLNQDLHLEVRGAILEDPVADPLPSGAFDPRVVDMDEDGHPGFTIPIAVFELIAGDTYIVQRLGYAVESDDVHPDAFRGSMDWSSEQVVIGGTDVLLMMPFDSHHHPDAARHAFVMRRLADDATCDDVAQLLEEERDAYLEVFPQTIEDESAASDG
jgi:hypothetical protein